MDLTEAVQIDSPAFKANPHPFYARMRATKPVCRVMLPTRQEAWLVSRYGDVSKLLKDPRLAKDPINAMSPEQLAGLPVAPKMFLPLTRNMLALDDPDHARLKRLVMAGFSPRRVELLTGRTETIAEQLLDGLMDRKTFDLVADFAMPLPVAIISDLLGVPERDRARFARWSHTLLSMPVGSWRMLFSLPDVIQFLGYLKKLVALKEREPGDDLVSALVVTEGKGEELSADELLAMIAILLSAGHETTTNLIANGTLALLSEPRALEMFQVDPGITQTAVEELLRFAGPVAHSTLRYTLEEIEIAGALIPQGAIVLGLVASANRDDRQFDRPDKLDLGRTPNRHLTFGEGGHYCIGAPLARMEGRVAFRSLFARFPDLKLAVEPDKLSWRGGLVLSGVKKLPVRACN